MLLPKNLKSVNTYFKILSIRVDFDTPTILGSENDTARPSILELLFIQEQTPDLNNDSQSSPLMIFNT